MAIKCVLIQSGTSTTWPSDWANGPLGVNLPGAPYALTVPFRDKAQVFLYSGGGGGGGTNYSSSFQPGSGGGAGGGGGAWATILPSTYPSGYTASSTVYYGIGAGGPGSPGTYTSTSPSAGQTAHGTAGGTTWINTVNSQNYLPTVGGGYGISITGGGGGQSTTTSSGTNTLNPGGTGGALSAAYGASGTNYLSSAGGAGGLTYKSYLHQDGKNTGGSGGGACGSQYGVGYAGANQVVSATFPNAAMYYRWCGTPGGGVKSAGILKQFAAPALTQGGAGADGTATPYDGYGYNSTNLSPTQSTQGGGFGGDGGGYVNNFSLQNYSPGFGAPGWPSALSNYTSSPYPARNGAPGGSGYDEFRGSFALTSMVGTDQTRLGIYTSPYNPPNSLGGGAGGGGGGGGSAVSTLYTGTGQNSPAVPAGYSDIYYPYVLMNGNGGAGGDFGGGGGGAGAASRGASRVAPNPHPIGPIIGASTGHIKAGGKGGVGAIILIYQVTVTAATLNFLHFFSP